MRRSPSSNSSLRTYSFARFPKQGPAKPDAFLESTMSDSNLDSYLLTAVDNIPPIPNKTCKYEPKDPIEITEPFPKEANCTMMDPTFISSFDLSTLLYIFYYFPMTENQLFAAKELEVRGWRYQTNCQTWFLRVSEPKEKTQEYEIADFLYFDHFDKKWCVRKRTSYQFFYENEIKITNAN